MPDTPPATYQEPTTTPDNKLTSEHFDEVKEALEVLYMLANVSGRLQFARAWPAAAAHVLGPELMKYDHEGAKAQEDREHRSEMEQAAEGRRIELLEFMDTLEEKSVDKGALQMDYVREAVTNMGRELSLLVYGPQIVDRFIAPPPKPEGEEKQDAVPDVAPAPAEENLRVMAEDPMDRIKPIDTEPSLPPSPAPEVPVPPLAEPSKPAPVAPPAVPPVPPSVEPDKPEEKPKGPLQFIPLQNEGEGGEGQS